MGQQEETFSTETETFWMTDKHEKGLASRLKLIFPQFMREHGKHMLEIMAVYRRVLQNQKITMEQFKRGVERMEGQNFYPNPGQFAELCKGTPEDFGLPTADVAYKEACEKSSDPRPQVFSHEVVYLAGRATGFFDLRYRGDRDIRKLFERNYTMYIAKLINGENIHSELPRALTCDQDGEKQQTNTPEVAGSAVHDILGDLTDGD